MPDIFVECPSCAWEGKIPEKLVGKRLKCRKCGTSFIAEVGGTYDLAETSPDQPWTPGPADSDLQPSQPSKGSYGGGWPSSWSDDGETYDLAGTSSEQAGARGRSSSNPRGSGPVKGSSGGGWPSSWPDEWPSE